MVTLAGLHTRKDYTVSIKVASADNLRYKYLNSRWCAVGESDVVENEEKQVFQHPNSPRSGIFWMKKPISFKAIKITNHTKSKHGNVSSINRVQTLQ